MSSPGCNYYKLKTYLDLAIIRLKLLEKEKTELSQISRREIADYLVNGELERSKIRVEHIIQDDYLVEAMEVIAMYCDLLLTRFSSVTQMSTLVDDLAEAISSLIWAAPHLQADVSELKIISEELAVKYGMEYALAARENALNSVNEKLMHNLNVQAPSKVLVEKYLNEIAESHNVPYEPDASVLDEAEITDEAISMVPLMELDDCKTEQLGFISDLASDNISMYREMSYPQPDLPKPFNFAEAKEGKMRKKNQCQEEEEVRRNKKRKKKQEEEVSESKMDGEEVPNVGIILLCRSVRIGSLKVFSVSPNKLVNVYFTRNAISFSSSAVSDANKIINITIKASDIKQMLVHFEDCLPIIFISTTNDFAANIRKCLSMKNSSQCYFDPNSSDAKVKRLTFLIESITKKQREFLLCYFLKLEKIIEIDLRVANKILVKSTPLHYIPTDNHTITQIVMCEAAPQPEPQPQLVPVSQEKSVKQQSVNTLPSKALPVHTTVTLFTYPPPPQIGGVCVTNDDLARVKEGKWLNDVLIDFYLKYIFYEKLSPYQQQKTHIFSTYFYLRLTKKPETQTENIKILHHKQVKNWTKNVDIFSKDFIVVPVNLKKHWQLAIICFPNLVPESPPDSALKSDLKIAKLSDNHSTTETEKRNIPCICMFDSLNRPNQLIIVAKLQDYLEVEWMLKKGTSKVFNKYSMPGHITKCPQQINDNDCGLYILQFVESFYKTPISKFEEPMPDVTNWFRTKQIAKKRKQLKNLILSFEKKSTPILQVATSSSGKVPPPVPAIQPSGPYPGSDGFSDTSDFITDAPGPSYNSGLGSNFLAPSVTIPSVPNFNEATSSSGKVPPPVAAMELSGPYPGPDGFSDTSGFITNAPGPSCDSCVNVFST